jgi:hypothetical protein
MRRFWAVILSLIFLGLIFLPGYSQSDEYSLNIRRNFGYSSGSQIKGNFTIDILGPANIKSVRYLIDGKVMADLAQSPFGFQFETTNYPYGTHELSAAIITSDGRQLTTKSRTYVFVTPEQESQAVTGIIFPILGLVVLFTVGGIGIQLLVLRRHPVKDLPPGTPRNYGFTGGTVCPRCHRPYPMHIWAVKLGFSKYDRCDFCGKWALVRSMKIADLRVAEQAEQAALSAEPNVIQKTEEEKLKEILEKSRYTDQS